MQRLLTVLLCAIPALLTAQWTHLGRQSMPLQMTSNYHGIRITHHDPVSPNAGPIWKVWRTDDDWVTEQLGYTGGGSTVGCCPVEAIRFLNDDVGFVQYMDLGLKHIARTADRGITFTELQPGGSFSLMPSNHADLWPLDDTTAYVVGENFALTGTQAYRITPTHNESIFFDSTLIGEGARIYFLDAQRGFVIATDHQGVCRLYRTIDGGLHWSPRLAVNVGPLRAIDFVNDTLGLVAGASGVCYKTIDAGATWISVAINGPVDVYAMDFVNAQVGYLSGAGGLVLRTLDGGLNWSSDVIDSSITLVYVKAVNATMAYVQSSDSVLYKRDYIAGANAVSSPTKAISVYPNPTQDIVHLALPDGMQLRDWQLLDLQGKRMLQGNGVDIGLQGLPRGLYLLEVRTSKGWERIKVILE